MHARPVIARPAPRRRIVASPALAIALLAVVGAGSVVLAADAAVSISGFAFSPGTVTVNVGDTVTWTNGDPTSHTATADGGSFDTGALANGESGAVTFDTAGSFPYHCSIHPQMTGTVVVRAAAATPAPSTPPAPGATPRATTPPTDVATSASVDRVPNLGGGIAVVAAAVAFAFAIGRAGRCASR